MIIPLIHTIPYWIVLTSSFKAEKTLTKDTVPVDVDAVLVLRQGGLAHGAIEAHYCYLLNGSGATKEILKLAQMRKCDTVVIGRRSLSWLSELIRGDPAEEFVRQGKGFTIWIVE